MSLVPLLSKWVPCLVTFSSHALQLKKNPEERKTVENLGKEMGACAILEFKRRLADADEERQRKREQDQTFNSQPTVKLVQIIPWL